MGCSVWVCRSKALGCRAWVRAGELGDWELSGVRLMVYEAWGSGFWLKALGIDTA